MRKIYLLPVLVTFMLSVNAQYVPIVIQDFDNVMTPAWNYTGNGLTFINGYSAAIDGPANSPFGIGGTMAWETLQQSQGDTMTFDNVNLAGYDSVYITFRLAAFSIGTVSNGPDQLDQVLAQVSVNGGTTWYDRVRVNGSTVGNNYWPYTSSGIALDNFVAVNGPTVFQPANTGLATTDGYSTVRINIPNTYTQVRLRLRSRESTAQERWCIDNVAVMGIPLNPAPPVAAFTFTPGQLCAGACANFTDQSTQSPTTWNWSFPGASTTSSTARNPTNICYPNSGTFSVQLITTNSFGSDTAVSSITVNAPPAVPLISAGGPLTFCQGDSVVLTSSSASGNTWNPGGATSRNFAAVTSGSYSVTVVQNGCSATSAPVVVTVNSIPSAPVISAGGPLSFCQGGSVVLSSSYLSGNIWSPGGDTAASVTATATNTFTAQVVQNGCTSAVSNPVNVVVNAIPVASITSSGNVMTASPSGAQYQWFDCQNGLAPLPGQNAATCTGVGGSSYAVEVTVNGCKDTSSCFLLSLAPSPSITPVSADICEGGCINFAANSTNSPTSWSWTFPGGSPASSNQQNPGQVCFASSGDHVVMLSAANASGSGSDSFTVHVHPITSVQDSAQICQGQTWTFHDGTVSGLAGQHVSQFASVWGCDSTITTTLTVISSDTQVTRNGATLQAASGPGTTWQWIDCNTGQPVNGAVQSAFTPLQSGNYAVVVTQNGCIDTSGCHAAVITGIAQALETGIQVYPQPITHTLHLQFPSADHRIIQLFTTAGQSIGRWECDRTSLDLPAETWASGVYLLQVGGNEKSVQHFRVVKQ